MINLLPQEKKKELRKNYRFRLVIVGSLLFSAVVVSLCVVLGSFYLLMRIEKNDMSQALEAVKADEALIIDKGIIRQTGDKLTILLLSSENVLATEAINSILDNKDDDIKINEISYSTSDTVAKIKLRGVAGTREKLLEFTRELEDVDKFSEIQSPISDLSKSTDITFSIDIDTKKDE